jgi:fructuronate reductase
MKIKILHLGLGRFHKAHQAVYYQRLLEEQGEEWGVAAFSMRSSEASDRLRSVQQKYPVIELGQNDSRTRWIECIQECYFAQKDTEKLKYFFCSPDISVITLTVTEKAYTQNILDPQSVIGILFHGLRDRKNTNGGKVTVLSCDNVRDNGGKLKSAIKDFAKHAGDSETMNWIEDHVKFPNSMVDRIVPALTPERLSELQAKYKVTNPELVATEFFSQWVIEDNIHAPFPALQKVGVQLVPDVVPYEEMKLYLLNASHSFLAYAGILKGYTYVHETVKDPQLAKELDGLHGEIIPFLNVPAGFDIQHYKKQMLSRFNNPELPHQLRQIAMDGSVKLQHRILPILTKATQKKLEKKHLVLCLDYWAEYCFKNIPDDPMKEQIEKLKSQCTGLTEFRLKFKEHFISNPALYSF